MLATVTDHSGTGHIAIQAYSVLQGRRYVDGGAGFDQGHGQKLDQGLADDLIASVHQRRNEELIGLTSGQVSSKDNLHELEGDVRHPSTLGGANVGISRIKRAQRIERRFRAEQLECPSDAPRHEDIRSDCQLLLVKGHGGPIHSVYIAFEGEGFQPIAAASGKPWE
jgi:hypothetical protein